jgi:hypothetical protein
VIDALSDVVKSVSENFLFFDGGCKTSIHGDPISTFGAQSGFDVSSNNAGFPTKCTQTMKMNDYVVEID